MNYVYIIVGVLAIGFIVFLTIILIKKNNIKSLKNELIALEIEKNMIDGMPIDSELSKLEILIKNEKMEEQQEEWINRYKNIKEEKIPNIMDMIVNLDGIIQDKDIKQARENMTKLDMEVYKVKKESENLLDEIENITRSEERNRAIITKLKFKFREEEGCFKKSKKAYGEIAKYIELQFENIEKKFQDFEEFMENNEFEQVSNIVKVLDEMIAHIGVIVSETPDLVLLLDTIIPSRIKEIEEIYDKMISKNFPLGYLKIEYNLEEINKKTKQIIDRLKILNIEDSMFELKTFLNYLDNLFNDFEIEKRSRRIFEENSRNFKNKITKVNRVVSDIYMQLEDIKGMYNLSDKDLNSLNNVNINLLEANEEYNLMIKALKAKEKPYSVLRRELDVLSNKLQSVELDLDYSLKTLGSMHDDELRAREQLDEITDLLKKCKKKIRSYNLPIISSNYYVELSEANEAINEIIKELEKTPITIKTLNIRVDTARDLALKLYNTTNEIVKNAKMSEMMIVYGNRYKPLNKNTNDLIDKATKLFFKGNYKEALETSINAINIIEPDIDKKIGNLYEEE